MAMTPELTVWCVCVGNKYSLAYVYALKAMIDKYLTIPHKFVCITEHSLVGIDTIQPPVPYGGWWAKIGLFYPFIAKGPSLYFDLDVVIVDNIDYLADYTDCEFAAPANWAQSGWGGIQSSVMAWSGKWYEPYNNIQWPHVESKFHGDQEYLYDLLGEKWERIEGVGSYKYHVIRDEKMRVKEGQIPDWMRVMVFHGQPKPHEAKDKCLLQYTLTLNNLITGNMPSGGQMGLENTA